MLALVLFFWLPLALVTGYALWHGGSPERAAAGLFIAAAVITAAVRPTSFAQYASVEIRALLVDALLMAGLVWLAVRAHRLWPIPMAALHGMTLLGHLGRAENPHLWELGYYLLINLPVIPEVALLAAATWLHQRRLRSFGTDRSWKS